MFYDRLVEACKLRGKAVSNVVLSAGQKLGSMNGWKNGAEPNAKAVRALAVELGVSADYLLNLPTAGLTIDEQALIDLYRQCSEADRAQLYDLASLYSAREADSKAKRAE